MSATQTETCSTTAPGEGMIRIISADSSRYRCMRLDEDSPGRRRLATELGMAKRTPNWRGIITGRAEDTMSRGWSADNQRLTFQSRVVPWLDQRVKRVHAHVQYDPKHVSSAILVVPSGETQMHMRSKEVFGRQILQIQSQTYK